MAQVGMKAGAHCPVSTAGAVPLRLSSCSSQALQGLVLSLQVTCSTVPVPAAESLVELLLLGAEAVPVWL